MSNNYKSTLQSNNTDLQAVLQALQTKAAGGGSGEAAEWSENEDAIVSRTISTYTNDRVTIIGNSAFTDCFSLTTVSFPVATIIGNSAFAYCPSLTTVSFPVATRIGKGAFAYCSSLTTASFPSATIIYSYAFYRCSALITVSFPKAMTIGSYAFADCYSLAIANFPAATTIGSNAFAYCRSLTIANFPAVTIIGNSAFINCYNLSQLYLTGSSVCTLSNSNAFAYTPYAGYSAYFSGTPHICVPSSLLTSYQTATNWTYFSSYFSAIEGEVNMITFTIDDIEYQAEKGMTWAEWVESGYNTNDQFAIDNYGYISASKQGASAHIYYNNEKVLGNNEIVQDAVYIIAVGGGSN